ncbi:MAG: AMP-binding protein [Planctomycetota bacterium]
MTQPPCPTTGSSRSAAALPRSIAEMFDATVAERGDQPALGVIEGGVLRWMTWGDVSQSVESLLAEINGAQDWRPADTGLAGLRTWLALAVRGPLLGLPPEQCTELVATSGTGGEPRGVLLSQQNLVSNTVAVAQAIAASLDGSDAGAPDADAPDAVAPDDRTQDASAPDARREVRLAFLPFSHLFARVCDLYCWVYRGSRMVLAESRETIFRDCQTARPTTLNGVPYFFQKAIDLAQRDGVPLRGLLGGRVRRCYCGGAALAEDVRRRFGAEGIPLLCGYGLTEASPVVTVSTIKANKPGTVGKPLPGVQVRTAADGEVLVRGPNVMQGYAGPDGAIDPRATAQAVRNGWLHTGDLGAIDAQGFLTIVGRKKEQLVLSTGKNVAPARLEALLAASPWIEQVAVVGDGRSCLGAVVVPNPQRLRAEVRRRRLWVWSKRQALRHPAVRRVFADEIAQRLAGCASHEQVRVFRLLGRPFSQERGEVTAKLSLRRAAIEQTLAREIAAMYADRPAPTSR